MVPAISSNKSVQVIGLSTNKVINQGSFWKVHIVNLFPWAQKQDLFIIIIIKYTLIIQLSTINLILTIVNFCD